MIENFFGYNKSNQEHIKLNLKFLDFMIYYLHAIPANDTEHIRVKQMLDKCHALYKLSQEGKDIDISGLHAEFKKFKDERDFLEKL